MAAVESSKKVTLTNDKTAVKIDTYVARTTLIFREVPSTATSESIRALVLSLEPISAHGAGAIVSVRPDINGVFFVALSSEALATAAAQELRNKTIGDSPVRVSIKAEHYIRTVTSTPPPAQAPSHVAKSDDGWTKVGRSNTSSGEQNTVKNHNSKPRSNLNQSSNNNNTTSTHSSVKAEKPAFKPESRVKKTTSASTTQAVVTAAPSSSAKVDAFPSLDSLSSLSRRDKKAARQKSAVAEQVTASLPINNSKSNIKREKNDNNKRRNNPNSQENSQPRPTQSKERNPKNSKKSNNNNISTPVPADFPLPPSVRLSPAPPASFVLPADGEKVRTYTLTEMRSIISSVISGPPSTPSSGIHAALESKADVVSERRVDWTIALPVPAENWPSILDSPAVHHGRCSFRGSARGSRVSEGDLYLPRRSPGLAPLKH